MIVIHNMDKGTHHLVDCSVDSYVAHMAHLTSFIPCSWESQEDRKERFLEWLAGLGWMVEDYYPPNTYALTEAPVPVA